MRAVLMIAMLAACSTSGDQTPEEHLQEVMQKTNADRADCVPGDWGAFGDIRDCANVCSPKPAKSEQPVGAPTCYSQYIIEVEGVYGYCVPLTTPSRVDWLPCGVQG